MRPMPRVPPLGREATYGDLTTWLWAAAALSLAVSLTPWGDLILAPFGLFTTWIHECAHAVAALAVGGHVRSITIHLDGSGLAHSLVPDGRLARGVVTSAGYIGGRQVGWLHKAAAPVPQGAPPIRRAVAAAMLVTLVFWVRNVAGVMVVLAWAGVLLFLAARGNSSVSRFVLGLLAVQVALNAVYDIRVLFMAGVGHSDADTMASLFWLPSWLWAGTWMLLSVGMLTWTLRVTRPRAAVGAGR